MSEQFSSVYSSAVNAKALAYAEITVAVAANENTHFYIGLTASESQAVQSGYGMGQSGTLYPSGTGTAFTTGSVLGFAYNQNTGNLWIAVNNTWVGGGNPATGSTPTLTGLSGAFFLAATIGSFNTAGRLVIATALDEFTYTPPSGFSSWSGS